ncbi:hypothetical protein TgHK011_007642 [Trichoderma gracile]|nr:hypothetical protein TgHK011_007642 [Trichoderma gracile]
MVNSSPEYSITKPGLQYLRKRDRPLRTYGRQPSTPEAQSEPPLKRRRVSAVKQQQQNKEEEEEEEEEVTSTPDSANAASELEATATAPASETTTNHDAPNQIKPDTKPASSSKGSILSYFKPAPAPSKPTKDETQPRSQESQSQPEDEPSTTPESPLKRKQPSRRKPRLLKIRPLAHESLDESSQEQAEPPHTSSDETATPQSRPPLKSTTPNTLQKASESEPSSSSTSLSPRKTSLRNHQKPRPSKPSSSSIQTTLNISSKAAFSECKICDTVWNPLYPDDVKFHNKTHKAVLRAQKKRKMDEL